tara:strand:- start:137 stop:373 length:237 start_codon:yes stop_codon:yes gene_type:complete
MKKYTTVLSQRFTNREEAIQAFIDNWGYGENFADYNKSATKFWTFSRLQSVYNDHCENYVKTVHGRTRKENVKFFAIG